MYVYMCIYIQRTNVTSADGLAEDDCRSIFGTPRKLYSRGPPAAVCGRVLGIWCHASSASEDSSTVKSNIFQKNFYQIIASFDMITHAHVYIDNHDVVRIHKQMAAIKTAKYTRSP